MHIPDGFLSLPVSLAGWLLLIGLTALALRQTRHQLGERQIPLLGVLAAFVFAAQMINFPVAGGTSGHLLGGALLAILVGPWMALLAMLSVLGAQAFLFQDGGLLALGFNTVNMGIVAAFVGSVVYEGTRHIFGDAPSTRWIGAAVAAWLSVVTAAAATALELALSGTAALMLVLPAMVGVHSFIGIGEALITLGALALIWRVRPEVAATPETRRGSGWIAVGLAVALAITLAAPLADPNPDGLERVAEDQGFISQAQDPPYTLLPDYTVPLIENAAVSTIVAGIVGTLIVAAISYAVIRAGAKRRERADS